jgi:HAD superfamily hydrolase (TIGR01484 family)
MRYHALASDYDGTLARHGQLDDPTRQALVRFRESGRRLLMVTGRELDDLLRVCPDLSPFDAVVAENGAVIYRPASRDVKVLAEAPPTVFLDTLRARKVAPLSVGRVIVATWEPNEAAVLDAIRDLGLELQVIFNKGAVMVLPSGVNKATGLAAALADLGLSPHNVVGVGDAENDHAFLALCECGVAVANALPMLKSRADLVTAADHGAGVVELIDRILGDDLREAGPLLTRYDIPLGEGAEGEELTLPAHGVSVLIAGTSGGGKSTFATGILERISERGYQYCIIDPEGDYSDFDGAVVVGDPSHPPNEIEVLELLEQPSQNAVVNLLGINMEGRPAFFEGLFLRLQEMRARVGRPHWIVIDETHHLLPAGWDPATLVVPKELHGLILITVHPDKVSKVILGAADAIFAIGKEPEETLRSFAAALEEPAPTMAARTLEPGEAIAWWRRPPQAPRWLRSIPPRAERKRHVRKYADGELGPDRSFYFRGPENKLNLRAQNLTLFMQVAEGVDDQTWLYHLRCGDYSRWFREAIKDEGLAEATAAIEQRQHPSAEETRSLVRQAIEERYTAPA